MGYEKQKPISAVCPISGCTQSATQEINSLHSAGSSAPGMGRLSSDSMTAFFPSKPTTAVRKFVPPASMTTALPPFWSLPEEYRYVGSIGISF